MKYRKKPIMVEAVQLRWDTWSEMCEFVDIGELQNGAPEGCYVDDEGKCTEKHTEHLGLQIPTLEGLMLAVEGDYVIRGAQGELYPCKPDIFAETYEPVYDADNPRPCCGSIGIPGSISLLCKHASYNIGTTRCEKHDGGLHITVEGEGFVCALGHDTSWVARDGCDDWEKRDARDE